MQRAMPAGAGAAVPPSRVARILASRATAALLLLLVVWRAVAAIVSYDGHDWDFTNFYNTGARVFHRELEGLYAPDGMIAGQRAIGDRTMVYTGFPLTALELAPIGWLAPDAALHAFKLLCAASYALALLLLWPWFRARFVPRAESGGALAIYLLLVLTFEPFWFTLRVGGQTTAFSLLGMAAFLRAWEARRPTLAAFCYAFAVLNKPFLGVGAFVVLVAGEWALLLRFAAWLAGAGALSLAIFGLALHDEWRCVVLEESSRWAVPWSKNAAPLALWNDLWLAPLRWPKGLMPAGSRVALVQWAWKIATLAGAALGARTVATGPASEGEKRGRLVLLALLLPLVFSTVVWPHYVALAFPLLAAAVSSWSSLSRAGLALTALAWLGLARANWPLVCEIERGVGSGLASALALGLFATLTLLAFPLLLVLERRALLAESGAGDASADASGSAR